MARDIAVAGEIIKNESVCPETKEDMAYKTTKGYFRIR